MVVNIEPKGYIAYVLYKLFIHIISLMENKW